MVKTKLNHVFDLAFTQAEVDFVIPDLRHDLRLAIDPFLMFKSRNLVYQHAHDLLLSLFNEAIQRFARGDLAGASALINFPEVKEIGFGYTETGTEGSGLGTYLNNLILDTLGNSPALVGRGVRHVEEMQLVSMGIGPDRVSDITGNVLKQFLVDYTQEQAALWGIPTENHVPIENAFDFQTWQWRDDYYELPVNRMLDKPQAILLVPRRLVRSLPWINFPDFERLEFAMFLRAKRARRSSKHKAPAQSKPEIVAVARREVGRIDRYVDIKEASSGTAQPENLDAGTRELCDHSDRLADELRNLPDGLVDAQRYQDLAFRILNFVLEPDLIEGKPQVRTEHGTEIRDLIYLNDSDKKFWDFARNQHGNLTVVFELKNKGELDNDDVNQLAGYLGDPWVTWDSWCLDRHGLTNVD